MPTYVKLPKGVTDFAPGMQSFNQLRNNIAATRASYGAEHVIHAGQPRALTGLLVNGDHNDPRIPKATFRLTPVYATPNSFFMLELVSVDSDFYVVREAIHASVGVVLVGIKNLTTFYAVPTVHQGGAGKAEIIHVQSRSSFGTPGLPGAIIPGSSGGLVLTTWLFDGTVGFAPADLPMSIALYGY